MQKSTATKELDSDILFPPLVRNAIFPTDFANLLAWNYEVPVLILPYEIESTLLNTAYHSYKRVNVLAQSAQTQIEDFFYRYEPDFKSYLAASIETVDAPTALIKAQKTKALAIKIKHDILRNKSWRTIPIYFNINALTLDNEERASLFAADVSTENERTLKGRARYTYEQFLIALTSAHVGKIMSNALLLLDKALEEADINAASAQIEENTANTILGPHTIKVAVFTGAQFSTTVGAALIQSAGGLSFETAIQNGVRYLAGLGEAVLSRVFVVGVGALFYSPSLGNGELYPATALSLPLKTLDPSQRWEFEEIAALEGSVDLRHRIFEGSKNYSIISTPPEGIVSSRVPVRALTYNAGTNSYFSITGEFPPIALGLPVHIPQDISTKLPGEVVENPTYTGITLSPILVTPESFPATDAIDFRDCIYCFPIETGFPPIYVVFSRPYGATTPGLYSGRWYDPEKAGGPTIILDWRDASITQEGIDLVKLHTGRFGQAGDNNVMIERLEKILKGELSAQPVDRKFYTHEIRELERYRALGIPDGVEQHDDGATWNNTHTATLEDFRLKDSIDQFYTKEAEDAAAQQYYE